MWTSRVSRLVPAKYQVVYDRFCNDWCQVSILHIKVKTNQLGNSQNRWIRRNCSKINVREIAITIKIKFYDWWRKSHDHRFCSKSMLSLSPTLLNCQSFSTIAIYYSRRQHESERGKDFCLLYVIFKWSFYCAWAEKLFDWMLSFQLKEKEKLYFFLIF